MARSAKPVPFGPLEQAPRGRRGALPYSSVHRAADRAGVKRGRTGPSPPVPRASDAGRRNSETTSAASSRASDERSPPATRRPRASAAALPAESARSGPGRRCCVRMATSDPGLRCRSTIGPAGAPCPAHAEPLPFSCVPGGFPRRPKMERASTWPICADPVDVHHAQLRRCAAVPVLPRRTPGL